jgi:hypothetical protein
MAHFERIKKRPSVQKLFEYETALQAQFRNDPVGKPSLFEKDRDLVPVRSGAVVKIDHRLFFD